MSKKANTNDNYLVVRQGETTVWSQYGHGTLEEARKAATNALCTYPKDCAVIFKAVSIIEKVDMPFIETEID